MKPTTVDFFSGSFTAEPIKRPFEPLLMGETLLNQLITKQQQMIDTINHHIEFDDIDAISDCLDEHSASLKVFIEEVKYCKENPIDILYGFKGRFNKPKFRRYANNKRTRERLRKA